MNCPKCETKINWQQIEFLRMPLSIKCNNCQKELIASTLAKFQMAIIAVLAFAFGLSIAAIDTSILVKVSILLIGVMALSLLNICLILFMGSYVLKKEDL